jgi:hypothetical protein
LRSFAALEAEIAAEGRAGLKKCFSDRECAFLVMTDYATYASFYGVRGNRADRSLGRKTTGADNAADATDQKERRGQVQSFRQSRARCPAFFLLAAAIMAAFR